MKGSATLALALVALAMALHASAASYYISPSGSDSNPGTQSMPFQTLSQAIDASSAGDTIYAASGLYTGAGNADLTFTDRSIIGNGTSTLFQSSESFMFTLSGGQATLSNLAMVGGDKTYGFQVQDDCDATISGIQFQSFAAAVVLRGVVGGLALSGCTADNTVITAVNFAQGTILQWGDILIDSCSFDTRRWVQATLCTAFFTHLPA